MTARALFGSDDRATDRILRASFWSAPTSSPPGTVIALFGAR